MLDFERHFATEKETAAHNKDVKKVWDAYKRGKPIRVPCDWGQITPHKLIHFDESLSFIKYIFDPEELIRLQGEAQYLTNKIITQDAVLKMPQQWIASLDYHTFMDEAFWGCPVKFDDRLQPKVYHLYDKEKVDPDEIEIPDPFHGNIMDLVYKNYRTIKELVKHYKVRGIPFSPEIEMHVAMRTYGLFNTAIALRGTNLFLDFYDDPQYVRKLMNKVADGYIARRNSWKKLREQEKMEKVKTDPKMIEAPVLQSYEQAAESPIVYDHGIHMISMDQYKEFLVPVYEKVRKEFGADRYDEVIEYCNTSEQLIRFYNSYFKVNKFWNLCGDVLDIAKLRHDLGEEAELQITINPEVVYNGPPERIERLIKKVLTPEVKGKGNLIFGMQFDNFSAPIENIRTLYQAVREYGGY
jgi:hypothetical protein